MAASPALGQAAVLPVPKNVKDGLDVASGSIVDGNAHAKVGADVLTLADGHLHLRENVPIGFGAVDQITGCEKFAHRRPHPAEAVVGGKSLSDGGIEKNSLRGDVGVAGQIRSELRLNKSVGGKKLI